MYMRLDMKTIGKNEAILVDKESDPNRIDDEQPNTMYTRNGTTQQPQK